jgi:uncharacterized RDD family membrane protein YckC
MAYQQQPFYGQPAYPPSPYGAAPGNGPTGQLFPYTQQQSYGYPPYAPAAYSAMSLAQSGPGSLATSLPRFGAFLFDLVIYGVMAIVLMTVAGALGLSGLGVLLALALHPLYFVGFWSTSGQTPGYKAAGLQLVKTDGTRPTLGSSIVRYVGWEISKLAFYLGCLWMIWDYQKQTWHDKMARTLVIRAQ